MVVTFFVVAVCHCQYMTVYRIQHLDRDTDNTKWLVSFFRLCDNLPWKCHIWHTIIKHRKFFMKTRQKSNTKNLLRSNLIIARNSILVVDNSKFPSWLTVIAFCSMGLLYKCVKHRHKHSFYFVDKCVKKYWHIQKKFWKMYYTCKIDKLHTIYRIIKRYLRILQYETIYALIIVSTPFVT